MRKEFLYSCPALCTVYTSNEKHDKQCGAAGLALGETRQVRRDHPALPAFLPPLYELKHLLLFLVLLHGATFLTCKYLEQIAWKQDVLHRTDTLQLQP